MEKTPQGKPFFPNHRDVDLSISDSRELWCIALADGPVGVDLQKKETAHGREGTDADCLRLAKRFFHPEELAWIEEGEVRERFFRIWCAKEAYVKMKGTGIDGDFAKFSVLSVKDAHFLPVTVREGYTCCICTAKREETGADVTWLS
ncbi:MAG: 4'-phosphopantetheinyl transferase superfamily protein [Eubacterium sp.]|nr:4'-phosphopantetheinyl transferase superfamily protein [Eubacterium sp.]